MTDFAGGGDNQLGDELRRVGMAAGLDAVGFAPAEPFTETRRHLEERRDAGLHGGMQFTYRNPARSTEPRRIVADAQALVVGARRYPSHPPRRPGADPASGAPVGHESGAERSHPTAAVARYATADHYRPLREALQAVADQLVGWGWQARVVADDNALVDREAAYRAGLGWYGKNTNLLLPGRGSWFVLGAVVTDAPLPVAAQRVADGCGACRRCLPACPTGALIAPGVLDARRCLAWLVQARGVFPAEYRVALGGRLYGCDDCQEACPENMAADRREPAARAGADGPGAARRESAEPAEPPATHRRADPGAGPGAAGSGRNGAQVDLLELLAASDAELLEWFGRWYIPDRQPRYLRRNALLALGNVADGSDAAVVDALRRSLVDADPLIRAHATWAAARLGRHDLLTLVAGDTDPDVRQEYHGASAVMPAGPIHKPLWS